MRKRFAQETTPNASVVPGMRRISGRMWEEGWRWNYIGNGMVRRDGEEGWGRESDRENGLRW